MKLPDGRVVQIELDWFDKLADFTLLFEVLVLAMAPKMPFAAVARLVNESCTACMRSVRATWISPRLRPCLPLSRHHYRGGTAASL